MTPSGHPDRLSTLNNLGARLDFRFQYLSDLGDNSKSISLLREALGVSPSDAASLTNLGNCLVGRFTRLGDIGDLDEAISKFREVLRGLPQDHPNRPLVMVNLGNALHNRFRPLGDIGSINEAVDVLNEVVKLVPDGHPTRTPCVHSLADCLLSRFKLLGDLGDLNHSVSMFREAIKDSLTGSEKALYLCTLGGCLGIRFERLGNLGDGNESIQVAKEAVALCPDGHPQKSEYLNSLGVALQRRSNQLGDLEGLRESVTVLKQTVALTPNGHPDKALRLTNLGTSLEALSHKSGIMGHLNDAISVLKEAVRLSPNGDLNKAILLTHLSNILLIRYMKLGDSDDYEQLITHYAAAACSKIGTASVRFHAAMAWAQLPQFKKFAGTVVGSSLTWSQAVPAMKRLSESLDPSARMTLDPGIWTESIPAYTAALNLLPELSWPGLSIGDRQHHLLEVGRVVRDAVGTAIACNEYIKAVEWLEQGRSIIWGQMLELRTPLDALEDTCPELAEKLKALSTQLKVAASRDSPPQMSQSFLAVQTSEVEPMHVDVQRSHQAAQARDQLLKEIRALDKFDRFLLPKTMSELSLAAERGPVVILNVGVWACDALVLMPGLGEEVLHIPVPNFDMERAEALGESLDSLVGGTGRGDRLDGGREGRVDPEVQFAHILRELWERVAKPVLEGLGYTSPSANPQRIWWCPTGPLTFLPIHAAGLYGKDVGFGSKLSDFVISSYTPSLIALLDAFRGGSHSQDGLQLLAVAQPSAEGQAYIPGTKKEIDDIQRLAQETAHQVAFLQLDGDAATLGSVQKGMHESHWVHFACHGVQNAVIPNKSALLVARSSRLTLSSIIKMSLPHADLAFLSACQTATGARDLQEESVHLASGMLLAGYRGVVATMWSIRDDDAPQVAADFYEHMFKTSSPDPTRAAEALHLAVGKLREGSGGKKSFFHWVPFVHLGA
ncbi:CHAT domain-containing protein [Mycena galericulata]|nr:CHAT domain-containing protein [Mycena galericulata]